MRLRFSAAIILLLSSPAAAQSCGPTVFVDAYRQAEAAYGRKEFAAAAAQLRPLAEQGLGPAQLLLGQLLADGQGVPANLVEAWGWLVLAADIGAPGAKEALTAVQARVSAEQRAQAKVDPATWRPKLGTCLARDPRVTRPDGTIGYNFDWMVNRVLKDASATGDEARRAKWLATVLESVRTGSPVYLIYLKSLHGVGFTAAGPFVKIETRDGLPLLTVNESFADSVSQQRLTDFVKAAVIGVHTALAPPPVVDTVSYKGRTIRTTASAGGKRFVEHIKAAIDLEDQLPPDLAKLARGMADLRYEPTREFDARGGTVALGTYRRDEASGRAYVSFTESFSMYGPSRLVITLVSTGIYARREAELTEAKRQLADARKRNVAAEIAKAEQRVGALEQQSRPSERGDCELEDAEIKAMEALKLDSIEINARYRQRTRRGCS